MVYQCKECFDEILEDEDHSCSNCGVRCWKSCNCWRDKKEEEHFRK